MEDNLALFRRILSGRRNCLRYGLIAKLVVTEEPQHLIIGIWRRSSNLIFPRFQHDVINRYRMGKSYSHTIGQSLTHERRAHDYHRGNHQKQVPWIHVSPLDYFYVWALSRARRLYPLWETHEAGHRRKGCTASHFSGYRRRWATSYLIIMSDFWTA